MLCVMLYAKLPMFIIITCLLQIVSILREEEISNNAYYTHAYEAESLVSQF